MRVLVVQHYYKEHKPRQHKMQHKMSPISRLSDYLITKCINSVKKYCEINNYDYHLSSDTLWYNYYENRWSNLCLERWIFASLRASEGNYDTVVVVDTDFLAVSDEPFPYCVGVSGYNKVHDRRWVVPEQYSKFAICGGITVWWKEHLHNFAKFINETVRYTRKQLPLTVLSSHDESFIIHFLSNNPHINIGYLPQKFNVKSHEKTPNNPVFYHLTGFFNSKINTYKSLSKETRDKILQ
jgi:hypothetical protein